MSAGIAGGLTLVGIFEPGVATLYLGAFERAGIKLPGDLAEGEVPTGQAGVLVSGKPDSVRRWLDTECADRVKWDGMHCFVA